MKGKLNLSEAWNLLLKTTPYLIMRLAIYSAIGLGSLVYFGVLFGLASIFHKVGLIVAIIVIGGLAGFYGIVKFLQHAVLYAVRAGHVAVLSELLSKGRLPEGKNQFSYGKEIVTSRFKEISVLFFVNELVDGVIRGFNRKVANVAEWLPIPGLDSFAKIVGAVVNVSVTYIDESILCFNLLHPERDVWTNAKEGVILYAMSWKELLKNAAVVALLSYGFVAVCFAFLAIPLGGIAAISHSDNLLLFALGFGFAVAYVLKLSVLDPLAMVAMIVTYRKEIEGKTPDLAWEARIEAASAKFRELKEKAAAAIASGGLKPAAGTPTDGGASGPAAPPAVG